MTTINTGNALGAKVVKYLPLNGTEGEIVDGGAVNLTNGGNYATDATRGKFLQGNGSATAATLDGVNFNALSKITLAFWAADINGFNLLQHGGDWTNNGGAFMVTAAIDAGATYLAGVNNNRGGYSATNFASAGRAATGWHFHVITYTNVGDGFGAGTPNPFCTWDVDGVSLTVNGGFGSTAEHFKNGTLEILQQGGGKIQKLAIFNDVLSSAERASLAADPDQIISTAAVVQPTPGPHKFWRVLITAKNGTQAGVFIGDMELRSSIPSDPSPFSSVDATQGGRAFASSHYLEYGEWNAFDGQINSGGTRWISAFDQGMPQFIGNELTSAVDIAQLWMVPSTDDNSCADNMPKDFELQYADAQNGPWVTKKAWTGVTGWVQGGSKWFDAGTSAPVNNDPIPAGAYRFIRMLISANGGDGYLSLQEMELHTSIGGADITNTSMPTAQSSFFAGDNATGAHLFDGNLQDITGAWTAAFPTTYPQWVSVDLGTPQKLAEIALLRVPASFADNRGPKDFKIQGSNTSLTANDWADIQLFTDVTYQVGTFKTLALATPTVVTPPDTGGGITPTDGAWKYLGAEGATVTVPANTRVRYGANGVYVEKTLSGSFAITTTTFGSDPLYGTLKHADYFSNEPATGYTAVGPTIGASVESAAFTVQANGVISGDMVVTPRATGLTFTPSEVVLNNSGLSGTFTATGAPGDYVISFTNNKALPNPASLNYKSVTSTAKTFGSAGNDFATLDAAINYAKTSNPGDNGLMVVLEGTADVPNVNSVLTLGSATELAYVIIRARKSLSFAELNKNGPINENVSGLTINIPPGSYLGLGGGVVIEGFKINITTGRGLDFRNDGAGPFSRLSKCLVLANAGDAIGGSAYRHACFDDTLIVRSVASGGKFIDSSWIIQMRRCTLVLKPGATASVAHNGGWGGQNGAIIEDTVYHGFGANPVENPGGFVRNNNYTNSDMADSGGFTVDKTGQFFQSGSNFRAGPALINKGSLNARSQNDVLGNNRGTVPDVGAVQNTAQTPLTVGVVTVQGNPDGQSVTYSGTYEGALASATVDIGVTDSPNGAVPQVLMPVTFSNGTFSVTIDDIPPGNYSVAKFTFVNAGGSSYANALRTFSIAGVNGDGVDTGGGPDVVPPTLVVSTAAASIMAGKTAVLAGTVNLQGDTNGKVEVYFDPQPSGNPLGPYAATVSGNNWSLNKPVPVGHFKTRSIATANGEVDVKTSAEIAVVGAKGNVKLPIA